MADRKFVGSIRKNRQGTKTHNSVQSFLICPKTYYFACKILEGSRILFRKMEDGAAEELFCSSAQEEKRITWNGPVVLMYAFVSRKRRVVSRNFCCVLEPMPFLVSPSLSGTP